MREGRNRSDAPRFGVRSFCVLQSFIVVEYYHAILDDGGLLFDDCGGAFIGIKSRSRRGY